MPQLIAGTGRRQGEARAKELLDMLGLAAASRHRPAQLSGGNSSAAIARALANAPRLCSPTSRPKMIHAPPLTSFTN